VLTNYPGFRVVETSGPNGSGLKLQYFKPRADKFVAAAQLDPAI